MRAWTCQVCNQLVFFENSVCLTCGSRLGLVPDRRDLVALEATGDAWAEHGGPAGRRWRPCANEVLAECNWLVDEAEPGDGLCVSCRLTRTRPDDEDRNGLAAFAKTEGAKRRLVFQLGELGLPVVDRLADPLHGLAFDLLSSERGSVTTGHADGIITLDLAESDDAYRTRMQLQMGEPYRTLLGHFRHEVGHYYWMLLVDGTPYLERFRQLFGDERADYSASLERHYRGGPPEDWNERYVSAYATMHPWEDWAETFAHYLHIRDAMQTADAYGVLVTGPADSRTGRRDLSLAAVPEEGLVTREGLLGLIAEWLPLTYALNAVNRSMGKDDLYPFVLPFPVIEKLQLVHDRIAAPEALPSR
jgi:hypothetical protein